MSEQINKTDPIIEKLLEEFPIFNQLEFNEFNIEEKLRENAYLAMKYRDHAITEKNVYERMELLMEKLRGELYHHYRFEKDENLQKSEIEQYYLPSDPKIVKLKKLMLDQKVRVDFFEAAYKSINGQSWSIKMFQENQRFGD